MEGLPQEIWGRLIVVFGGKRWLETLSKHIVAGEERIDADNSSSDEAVAFALRDFRNCR